MFWWFGGLVVKTLAATKMLTQHMMLHGLFGSNGVIGLIDSADFLKMADFYTVVAPPADGVWLRDSVTCWLCHAKDAVNQHNRAYVPLKHQHVIDGKFRDEASCAKYGFFCSWNCALRYAEIHHRHACHLVHIHAHQAGFVGLLTPSTDPQFAKQEYCPYLANDLLDSLIPDEEACEFMRLVKPHELDARRLPEACLVLESVTDQPDQTDQTDHPDQADQADQSNQPNQPNQPNQHDRHDQPDQPARHEPDQCGQTNQYMPSTLLGNQVGQTSQQPNVFGHPNTLFQTGHADAAMPIQGIASNQPNQPHPHRPIQAPRLGRPVQLVQPVQPEQPVQTMSKSKRKAAPPATMSRLAKMFFSVSPDADLDISLGQ